MDIRIYLLLAAEAGAALVLLRRSGALPKPVHVLCAALLLAAAFALRGACLNYVTDVSPRCASRSEIIMYRI